MNLRLKAVGIALLGLAVQATAANDEEVAGLKVVHVEVVDKTATITIQNVSQTDVTGYTILIDTVFADGHKVTSGRTLDYGPLMGQALHPGESTQEVVPAYHAIASVNARAVVAFYADQTAEATDERLLTETMDQRKNIAETLQLEADALQSAMTEAEPKKAAQQKMQKLLDDRRAERNHATQSFLEGTLSAVNQTPEGAEQRGILQEHADLLQRHAVAFAAYANVRRRR